MTMETPTNPQYVFVAMESAAEVDDGLMFGGLKSSLLSGTDPQVAATSAALGCRHDIRASKSHQLNQDVYSLRPANIRGFVPWRGVGGDIKKRVVEGTADIRFMPTREAQVVTASLQWATGGVRSKSPPRDGNVQQIAGPAADERDLERVSDLMLSLNFRQEADTYSLDISGIVDSVQERLYALRAALVASSRSRENTFSHKSSARIRLTGIIAIDDSIKGLPVRNTVTGTVNVHNSETIVTIHVRIGVGTQGDVFASTQQLKADVEVLALRALALDVMRVNLLSQTSLLVKLMRGAGETSTMAREDWQDSYSEFLSARADFIVLSDSSNIDVDPNLGVQDLLTATRMVAHERLYREDFERFGRELALLPPSTGKIPLSDGINQADPLAQRAIEILEERKIRTQVKMLLKDRREGFTRTLETVPKKMISIHPFFNRDAVFQEMQASLTVTTLMTATSGIILSVVVQAASKNTKLDVIQPWDLALLFIATFAFFYSTLICANAVSRLARQSTILVEEQLDRAAAYAEYLGKYPFIMSLTMVLIASLHGVGLWVQILVGALGVSLIVGYSKAKGISLLMSDFGASGIGTNRSRMAIQICIGTSCAALAVTTILATDHWYSPTVLSVVTGLASTLLLAILCAVTLLSSEMPKKSNTLHYTVDLWDKLGKEREFWK